MDPALVGIFSWEVLGFGTASKAVKPSYAGKIDHEITQGDGILKLSLPTAPLALCSKSSSLLITMKRVNLNGV